ncbi:hypothetical protein LZK77_30815 (plasmid) [Rhizobium leguminosarum]|nr:hypothetical protein LZK77_30815 [Rhizobium leguminosarum]
MQPYAAASEDRKRLAGIYLERDIAIPGRFGQGFDLHQASPDVDRLGGGIAVARKAHRLLNERSCTLKRNPGTGEDRQEGRGHLDVGTA